MKKISSKINFLLIIILVICTFILVFFEGCYSFTGGSVPEHLKTIYVAPVNDNSGIGNPTFRELLNQNLIDKFRNDNSLQLVDSEGDAKLYVSIRSITDELSAVKQGELEKERKVTVACEAEYYDATKKITIWKKNFSNYNVYFVDNTQTARDNAIKTALEQTSDDILLAVVSGW